MYCRHPDSRSYKKRNSNEEHLYGNPVGDSSNESEQANSSQHSYTNAPCIVHIRVHEDVLSERIPR